MKNMAVRMLTTNTRRRVESIIDRLANGQIVSLVERIQLKKYSLHIPFVASKVDQALRKREALDEEELV